MAIIIEIHRSTADGPSISWDTGTREATSDFDAAKRYEYAAEVGARVTALLTDPTITKLEIERH